MGLYTLVKERGEGRVDGVILVTAEIILCICICVCICVYACVCIDAVGLIIDIDIINIVIVINPIIINTIAHTII